MVRMTRMVRMTKMARRMKAVMIQTDQFPHPQPRTLAHTYSTITACCLFDPYTVVWAHAAFF